MSRPLGMVLLDDIESQALEEVVALVSKKLGVDVGLLGRIECRTGFDPKRRQWRADVMVRQCVEKFSSADRFTLGLTGRDLYVPSLNFVFGLALRREGLAIVSWYRLGDGSGTFVTRLAKEIIHEVGHLEGLDHCNNDSCVMWFSNTLPETDRKGLDFCPACARKRSQGSPS
jgi:archaemetzincin